MDVRIYHNPACSTSRKALALLREKGLEPQVIEYLVTPPDATTLTLLLAGMRMPARALLRTKEAPYAVLELDNPALSEEALIQAMVENPILINRPIVATPLGVRLGRPVEAILDILPR